MVEQKSLDQLLRLVPGRRAIIIACEAAEHGDNAGCVCRLIGHPVTIGKQFETAFAGTPSWHLEGTVQRVRLAEIVFQLEPA